MDQLFSQVSLIEYESSCYKRLVYKCLCARIIIYYNKRIGEKYNEYING